MFELTAIEQVTEFLCEMGMGKNLHPDVQGDWQPWLDFFTIPVVRICPKCGDRLSKKNGRCGEFWGCDDYPDCKHTEN